MSEMGRKWNMLRGGKATPGTSRPQPSYWGGVSQNGGSPLAGLGQRAKKAVDRQVLSHKRVSRANQMDAVSGAQPYVPPKLRLKDINKFLDSLPVGALGAKMAKLGKEGYARWLRSVTKGMNERDRAMFLSRELQRQNKLMRKSAETLPPKWVK